MKTLTLFLTLTFILSASLLAFADFESAGEASCNGVWEGFWPWEKSDSTITEYWEWKNLGSMSPYLAKSEKPRDPAKVWASVGTYQATRGRGTVGVSADGSVSGPDDFSLDLGFEWKTSNVSGDDTTTKNTTGSQSTLSEGSYTLSGSGQVMATAGGGSIGVSISGTGGTLRGSGNITFSDTPTYSAPSPLVVTTEKDLPSAYECAHQNCEVALPNKYHHRVTCKEKVYLGLGSVIKVDCNDKYYACQTSTCPSDDDHIVPHACGHEDEKDEAWKHAQQASCSGSTTRNGSTVYCQSTNYYLCQHENHDFPSGSGSTNGGSTTGGSTNGGSITDNTPDCSYCTDGCSSCQAPSPPPPPPSTTSCSAGHPYNPNNSSAVNRHRTRTCRFSECGQTWQACVNGSSAPLCNKPYRNQNGLSCWAQ